MGEFDDLTTDEQRLIRQRRMEIAMNSYPPNKPKIEKEVSNMVTHLVDKGRPVDPTNPMWAKLEAALPPT